MIGDEDEFNMLLKIVEEKNSLEAEKCLICHFPDNNLLKLKCGHYFHFECLNINFKNKKKKLVTCPYCDKKGLVKTDDINLNSDKVCKIILKTGVNKGKECGRINCRYHKIS